jgi:hypothetical protein
MTSPIYPKALASWTDRIDNVNTIWAADPNSLAAEIVSMEQTFGTMPQVEPSPPIGNPVTYPSVSARITDTLLGTQQPYVELYASNFTVSYPKLIQAGYLLNYSVFNTFKAVEDNWGYFNGSDITVQTPGVYMIDSFQVWSWYKSGWLFHMLTINNNMARGDRWDWNFPTSGPNSENYAGHWARTGWTWMGPLNKGDRIRVASLNATTLNPYPVVGSSLRMQYLRGLTSSQVGPMTYPS